MRALGRRATKLHVQVCPRTILDRTRTCFAWIGEGRKVYKRSTNDGERTRSRLTAASWLRNGVSTQISQLLLLQAALHLTPRAVDPAADPRSAHCSPASHYDSLWSTTYIHIVPLTAPVFEPAQPRCLEMARCSGQLSSLQASSKRARGDKVKLAPGELGRAPQLSTVSYSMYLLGSMPSTG